MIITLLFILIMIFFIKILGSTLRILPIIILMILGFLLIKWLVLPIIVIMGIAFLIRN